MSVITNTLASVPDVAPISGGVWPLQNTAELSVPTNSRFPGRSLGSGRSKAGTSLASRTHAGVDLFASYLDVIVAIADGEIINFYHFYRGTFCLIVDHGSFVANYGEVDRDSLTQYGLKTPLFRDGSPTGSEPPIIKAGDSLAKKYPFINSKGSSVKAGQPIARVGRMFRDSMLHIEFYTPGTTTNLRWLDFNSPPPSGLRNGTGLLQTLSSPIVAAKPVEKELAPRDVVCA